jgi:hypothetical protein
MSALRIAAALFLVTGAAVTAQTTSAPSSAPPAAAPEMEPDAAVTRAEARSVAAALADQLETSYVFPDVARRYAEAVRSKAAAGEYDGLTTRGALADRLTADLRAVSPDNHLRVFPGRPGPDGPGPRRVMVRQGGGAAAPPPGAQVRRVPMARPEPLEQARWVAPGVAFVRFNLFPGSPEAVEAARRFILDHAAAKTIIFDIRTHRGGGLDEMDAMFPYLFARPTTLVTMDTRASVDRERGNPLGDARLRLVPTKEDVVRREHYVEPGTDKRLFGAKIYVLTSNRTGSAAEHFALAMKRTRRGTLIGEATAGAGHYGGMQTVGDNFAVFIPVGRTFDPDTGKGWETVGVAPDVAVPAERALYEALVRSGVAAAEAEKLSEELKPSGPLRRPPPPAG